MDFLISGKKKCLKPSRTFIIGALPSQQTSSEGSNPSSSSSSSFFVNISTPLTCLRDFYYCLLTVCQMLRKRTLDLCKSPATRPLHPTLCLTICPQRPDTMTFTSGRPRSLMSSMKVSSFFFFLSFFLFILPFSFLFSFFFEWQHERR